MMMIFMTTMAMTDDDGDDSDKLMTNSINSDQKLRILDNVSGTSLVRATAQRLSLPLWIDRFHSRGQQQCKFLGTKDIFYIRKESNSSAIISVHQNGRRFIVYTNTTLRSCENDLYTLYHLKYWLLLGLFRGRSKCPIRLLEHRISRDYMRWISFFNDIFHIWSLLRVWLHTAPYEASKHVICYQGNLFLALVWIWQFPDAHLAQENSKTINVDLSTKTTL